MSYEYKTRLSMFQEKDKEENRTDAMPPTSAPCSSLPGSDSPSVSDPIRNDLVQKSFEEVINNGPSIYLRYLYTGCN